MTILGYGTSGFITNIRLSGMPPNYVLKFIKKDEREYTIDSPIDTSKISTMSFITLDNTKINKELNIPVTTILRQIDPLQKEYLYPLQVPFSDDEPIPKALIEELFPTVIDPTMVDFYDEFILDEHHADITKVRNIKTYGELKTNGYAAVMMRYAKGTYPLKKLILYTSYNKKFLALFNKMLYLIWKLHKYNISHHDLHDLNIIINTQTEEVYIIDFSEAIVFTEDKRIEEEWQDWLMLRQSFLTNDNVNSRKYNPVKQHSWINNDTERLFKKYIGETIINGIMKTEGEEKLKELENILLDIKRLHILPDTPYMKDYEWLISRKNPAIYRITITNSKGSNKRNTRRSSVKISSESGCSIT